MVSMMQCYVKNIASWKLLALLLVEKKTSAMYVIVIMNFKESLVDAMKNITMLFYRIWISLQFSTILK